MSAYFYIADDVDKKLYFLGKQNHAKYILPYMAYLLIGRKVCLFCDEVNIEAAGRYSDDTVWKDINWELDDIPNEVKAQLDEITMSRFEFQQIFIKIGGYEIINLEDYIYIKFMKHEDFKKKQREWFEMFEF